MPLDLAVLGQDPRFGGGGLAQTDAFLAGAKALGRAPRLLYAPHPALRGQRLSWRRIEALRQLHATRQLATAARESRSLWVVATLAHHGGAAPRSSRPYGCWIGTTIESEWLGRAPGLPPGHRLLAGLSLPALRRIERRVLGGPARLYATSAASRASVAVAANVPESSVAILPIPVDIDHFTPEADEGWLARLGAPVIAFLGRTDDPRKNVPLLIRAFRLVQRELPAARLRLIGPGPIDPIGPGIDALGFVRDVAAPLRECALLVSTSHQEGFGIAVAEALACGVPAIVTPSGGPEEMVRASGAGRISSSWSERELADTILDLLSDVPRLQELRRLGRDYVAREHAPERFRELLVDAFRELDG